MLLSFTVKNFYSINEFQSLILEPELKLKEQPQNIFSNKEYSALKSVAIFGHNASGKSNIIKAINEMQSLVLFSFKQATKNELDYEPFKYNNTSKDKPTEFEIEVLIKDTFYRYSFAYNSEEIVYEKLILKNNKKRAKERVVLFREKQDFVITPFKAISKSIRENVLFLTYAYSSNKKIAEELVAWFRDSFVAIDISDHNLFSGYSSKCIAEGENKDEIINFIKQSDLAIVDIVAKKEKVNFSEIPEELVNLIKKSNKENKELSVFKCKSKHNIYDEEKAIGTIDMDFTKYESAGTQKLYNIAGVLIDVLKNGKTLFADELDAQLHPLLLLKILEMFNSEYNKNNAQLVFTSLSPFILEYGNFRRDQVVFAEKNKFEESEYYPLSRFKTRSEVDFAKSYLFGRYGAIPNLPHILKWWR